MQISLASGHNDPLGVFHSVSGPPRLGERRPIHGQQTLEGVMPIRSVTCAQAEHLRITTQVFDVCASGASTYHCTCDGHCSRPAPALAGPARSSPAAGPKISRAHNRCSSRPRGPPSVWAESWSPVKSRSAAQPRPRSAGSRNRPYTAGVVWMRACDRTPLTLLDRTNTERVKYTRIEVGDDCFVEQSGRP
jgi:hypothetical protein